MKGTTSAVGPSLPYDLGLVPEPNANDTVTTYQEAMFQQGIPLVALEVSDNASELARLKARGVAFRQGPTAMGPVTMACSQNLAAT